MENCKYFLLACFAYVFCCSSGAEVYAYSQKDSVDILRDTTGIGKKIDSTLQEAFRLRKVNFDSAMKVCESVYPEVLKNAKRRRLAVYYAVKGAIMHNNGRALNAVTWLNKARDIANDLQDNLLQIKIASHLLACYILLGQYETALKIGLDIQTMSEQIGDSLQSATTKVNLGLLYYKMADAKTALQYYYKVLAAYGARRPVATVFLNMGLCHNQLRNYDSAFYYYAKGKSEIDSISSVTDLLLYHHSFANSLIATRKFGGAEKHLWIAINIAKGLGEDRFLADSYSLLGIIFKENGQLDNAIKWQLHSEDLYTKNGMASGLGSVYQELVEVYRLKGDFRRVVTYQSKYLANWRDVYGEDVMVGVSLLEGEFNERGNSDRLAANTKLVELRRGLWQTRNSIIMAGFAVLGLLIVVVIILMHVLRRQRKANEMIEAEVRERTESLEADLEKLIKSRNLTNKSMQDAFRFLYVRMATVKGGIQLIKMSANFTSGASGSGPFDKMEIRLKDFRLDIER